MRRFLTWRGSMSEREMRTLLTLMLVGLAGAWKPVVSAAATPPPPQRTAKEEP